MRWTVRLTLLALALATLSCNSSGVDEPPASFAGVWELTATNLSDVTFVHCTGSMAVLEGMPLDGPGGETVTCYSDVSPVIQNGSTVTLMPVEFSCDNGESGTASGEGTVDGKHITYRDSTSFNSDGVTVTNKYTGSKTSATTFLLDEWQTAVSGAVTGSCNLSPKLRYDCDIVDWPTPFRRKVRNDAIPGRLVPKLRESLGEH
jgi:hypothetical protein